MKLETFPFYGDAFRRAVAGWPKDAVGAYTLLLVHQWFESGVPADDPIALARIIGESKIRTVKLWSICLPKFKRGADGLWRNPRLEVIRDQELERIRRASDHGRRGAEGRWGASRIDKPASTWKRANRIAHEIMDANPDGKWAEWVEEFKSVCAKQGIDYSERGGRSKTPLYMRALEYVDTVKKNRVKQGQPSAWRKKKRA